MELLELSYGVGGSRREQEEDSTWKTHLKKKKNQEFPPWRNGICSIWEALGHRFNPRGPGTVGKGSSVAEAVA